MITNVLPPSQCITHLSTLNLLRTSVVTGVASRPNSEIEAMHPSVPKPFPDWLVGSLSSWVVFGDELACRATRSLGR